MKTLVVATTASIILFVGCERDTVATGFSDEAQLSVPGDADALEGIVIRKEWTKTQESWNAGGSDYFVLDTADALLTERTAKEGVVLIPTLTVPAEALAEHVGSRVKVTGKYTKGERFEPLGDEQFMQHPVSPDDLQVFHGAGFSVATIEESE